MIAQITLGAWTIWSNKAADIATAHVAVGAVTFAIGILISAVLLRLRHREQDDARPPRRPNLAAVSAT